MLLWRAWIPIRMGRHGTAVLSALVSSVAVVAAGCTGTSSVSTNPDPAACHFTIAPPAQLIGVLGGSGNIVVATRSGCTWTATTDVGWITLRPPTSGSGNGTVNFAFAGNLGASERTGSVIIADQRSTFTQMIGTTLCTYAIDPLSQSIGAAGGAGVPIRVSTGVGCQWTSTSDAPWITVTAGAIGVGDGVVALSVAANTGDARTGTLTIADRTAIISQTAAGAAVRRPPPSTACPYTISPNSNGGASSPDRGTIAVTTTGTCPWRAISNDAWLTIVSGESGMGSGAVNYAVSANNTGATRTGTLTVAGFTFTYAQARFGPGPR